MKKLSSTVLIACAVLFAGSAALAAPSYLCEGQNSAAISVRIEASPVGDGIAYPQYTVVTTVGDSQTTREAEAFLSPDTGVNATFNLDNGAGTLVIMDGVGELTLPGQSLVALACQAQ